MEHAQTKKDRLAHAEEFAEGAHRFVEERLDPEELADIVREACAARNGWKVILSRCAPTKLVRQKVNSLVIGSNE